MRYSRKTSSGPPAHCCSARTNSRVETGCTLGGGPDSLSMKTTLWFIILFVLVILPGLACYDDSRAKAPTTARNPPPELPTGITERDRFMFRGGAMAGAIIALEDLTNAGPLSMTGNELADRAWDRLLSEVLPNVVREIALGENVPTTTNQVPAGPGLWPRAVTTNYGEKTP